jgi:hypothetical protein
MRENFFQAWILFLLGRESWASDFVELYEDFFHGSRFSELDLFAPIDEFRLRLELESIEHRRLRLSLMPSGILFQQLIQLGSHSLFLQELSVRSFEEVRLVLLFFADMLKFCLFTCRQDDCPFCPGTTPLSSAHFLDCSNIFHSPLLPPPDDLPLPSQFDPWRTM